MYERNFPVIPGRTRSGIKTTMLIRDVFMLAALYVLTDINIAVLGLNHFFMFSYAASMNTMTVSIHAQNAKMREKLVRKLSVRPDRSKQIKVMKNDIIIPRVDIADCFIPINNAVIIKTNSIDQIALDHSDL